MAYKELIQRIDVGAAGAVSLMFSNIPQTYTDLVVIFSGRSSRSGTDGYPVIRFNNSTSGYAYRTIYSEGANSSGTSYSGSDRIHFGYTNGNGSTSNNFSCNYAYIPNYTSSSNKSVLCDAVQEENATISYLAVTANTWSNTSPITSLEIHEFTETYFVQYTTASLYGIKRGSDGIVNAPAVGGTITTSGGYTYHTFTSSGTFTVNKNLSADMLVIAGGGAGGIGAVSFGGGGGAGGYRTTLDTSPLLLTPGSYACIIGAGGTGVGNRAIAPTSGTNSSLATIIATGGGYGGNESNFQKGANGGSSGGANYDAVAYAGNAGGFTPVEGYTGANGYNTSSSGGGGGAGQAGQNSVGGNGRNTNSTWATATSSGVSGYYAGGGGSGTYPAQTPYAGGLGGGGSAGNGGAAGTANTGSGGGASNGFGGTNNPGGNGGSGIVIIRYLTPA